MCIKYESAIMKCIYVPISCYQSINYILMTYTYDFDRNSINKKTR